MAESIGTRIKKFRKAKKMNQTQFAVAAGLPAQSTVSNIERGLQPGPSITARVEKILNG